MEAFSIFENGVNLHRLLFDNEDVEGKIPGTGSRQERGDFEMWWDYLKLEDNEEQVVYIYGREAIGLDGEIVYDRKKRRWSVTIPCKKDAGNPNNIAETERKSWEVVKAGFPPSLHVAIW